MEETTLFPLLSVVWVSVVRPRITKETPVKNGYRSGSGRNPGYSGFYNTRSPWTYPFLLLSSPEVYPVHPRSKFLKSVLYVNKSHVITGVCSRRT